MCVTVAGPIGRGRLSCDGGGGVVCVTVAGPIGRGRLKARPPAADT